MSVQFDREDSRGLRELAKKTDRTMASIVRFAVKQLLNGGDTEKALTL